jgi:hypothetical protein
MFEHLEYFSNNTRLTNFPSIKYGVDSSNALNALFNRVALPQINFYNEEHKLIKTFNGEIPIDSLKPYIN